MRPTLSDYERYIERVKATGSRVIHVTMPCCDKPLDVHVPASKPHAWTSLMLCPHCGTQWMSKKTRALVTLSRPSPDIEDAYERHVLVPEKAVTR